jgi:uncharacterized protein (DUF736 family)
MTSIGSFKKSGAEYVGEISTLSVQTKNVRVIPETTRANDTLPTHRVFVGKSEVGAGWMKRSAENRDYLSIKLDDPALVAPIYASLFENEGGEDCSLVWSRTRRNGGD